MADQRRVGLVVAARREHARLGGQHPEILLDEPHPAAELGIAHAHALGFRPAVYVDGLEGGFRHQREPVGQAVFGERRDLRLAVARAGMKIAVRVEGLGAVGQRAGDDELAVTGFQRPRACVGRAGK